jgi:hypothetical protein
MGYANNQDLSKIKSSPNGKMVRLDGVEYYSESNPSNPNDTNKIVWDTQTQNVTVDFADEFTPTDKEEELLNNAKGLGPDRLEAIKDQLNESDIAPDNTDAVEQVVVGMQQTSAQDIKTELEKADGVGSQTATNVRAEVIRMSQ